jgi:hypothetical protein
MTVLTPLAFDAVEQPGEALACRIKGSQTALLGGA